MLTWFTDIVKVDVRTINHTFMCQFFKQKLQLCGNSLLAKVFGLRRYLMGLKFLWDCGGWLVPSGVQIREHIAMLAYLLLSLV
jgi:hypothetical protein